MSAVHAWCSMCDCWTDHDTSKHIAAARGTPPERNVTDEAMSAATCENCERCTWNPGSDCGVAEHPHCERCGHCIGRHVPGARWGAVAADSD